MERLFPRALVACIGEGRPPEPQELAAVRDKIWREAFPQADERGAAHNATNLARAALIGRRLAA